MQRVRAESIKRQNETEKKHTAVQYRAKMPENWNRNVFIWTRFNQLCVSFFGFSLFFCLCRSEFINFRFIFQAENFNKYLFPFLFLFCQTMTFFLVRCASSSFSLYVELTHAKNQLWFQYFAIEWKKSPFWIFQICRRNSNRFTMSWLKIDWIFITIVLLIVFDETMTFR